MSVCSLKIRKEKRRDNSIEECLQCKCQIADATESISLFPQFLCAVYFYHAFLPLTSRIWPYRILNNPPIPNTSKINIMEPLPQEPDEPTPLVVPPPQEPVKRSTRVWTIIGFVATGILLLAFVPLAVQRFSIRVVLGPPIAMGITYFFYYFILSRVGRVGGTSMRHDLAQAYIACGLWPRIIVTLLSCLLITGLSYVLLAFLVYKAQPAWLRRIVNAIEELDKHGELRVGGIPLKTIFGLQKSSDMLKHLSLRQLNVISSPHRHPQPSHLFISIIPTIRTISAHLITTQHTKKPDIASMIQKFLRIMVYEDGTKAPPLFGEVFRSLGSFPYWMIIPLFLNELLLAYVIYLILAKFVETSMSRPNPTLQTVTACAMYITLGSLIPSFFILSIDMQWSFLPSIIGIPFTFAISALIGMRLFDNTQSVFEDEKRPVLMLPVLLSSISSFASLLCTMVAARQIFYLLATAVELRMDLNKFEFEFLKWSIFMVVVPSLVLLGITIYAVRLAWSRFSSSRA